MSTRARGCCSRRWPDGSISRGAGAPSTPAAAPECWRSPSPRAHGALAVDAVDRDALAVALTAANAGLNRIDRVRSRGSLVLDGRVEGPYDLAVCNLPAKAGHPVLEALVGRLAALVRPGGVVAVVVVAPLADLVAAAITEGRRARRSWSRAPRDHVVFHYRGRRVRAGHGWGRRRAGPVRAQRGPVRGRQGRQGRQHALRHDDGLRPAGLRHAELRGFALPGGAGGTGPPRVRGHSGGRGRGT